MAIFVVYLFADGIVARDIRRVLSQQNAEGMIIVLENGAQLGGLNYK